MNASEDRDQALYDLFEAHLEGTISPSDFARLEARIAKDAEVRRQYVEYMSLHASLDRQIGESLESSPTDAAPHATASPKAPLQIPPSTTTPFEGHGLTALLGIGFAVMTVAFIFVFVRSYAVPSIPKPDAPAMPVYVATLVSAQHCRWGDRHTPLHPGTQLQAGQLNLVEGVAEILFVQGARVTLTGPVVFDLLSANRGALRQGRLTANVPESAHGFTIEAPGGKVIDYGTEFALVVNDSGHADVNVIEGEVEVVGNDPASSQMLTSGEVLRFDVKGKIPPVNLAVAPGAEAFAADVISLFPERHQIVHVNDSQYGNSHSWIGGPQSRFIAIRLSGPCRVEGIAFGRDNTGEFTDRCLGHYELQYTTVDVPNIETPDDQWTTIRGWDYDGTWPDRTPAVRHRYDFPAVRATAVRLVVPYTGAYHGTAIDELEIYGTLLDASDE